MGCERLAVHRATDVDAPLAGGVEAHGRHVHTQFAGFVRFHRAVVVNVRDAARDAERLGVRLGLVYVFAGIGEAVEAEV